MRPIINLALFLSTAAAASLLVSRSAQAQSADCGAIFDNGTIRMGVNCEGHLNYPFSPDPLGINYMGLRYLPTGAASTEPGCQCEGWGVADSISNVSGYANVSSDNGVHNLTLVSFSSTANSARSEVRVGNTFNIVHDYHPSTVTPYLYEVTVTVTNISSLTTNALYRRVMDWDIYPTPFDEYVTIVVGNGQELYRTDTNGFNSSNPFSFSSYEAGPVHDAGPGDIGALFDFDFGPIAPGHSRSFRTFYGAAGSELDAMHALALVEAEAFSLGQPNVPGGPTTGAPNTFIFAFNGIGGDNALCENTGAPPPTCTESDPCETLRNRDLCPAGATDLIDTVTVQYCTGADDPAATECVPPVGELCPGEQLGIVHTHRGEFVETVTDTDIVCHNDCTFRCGQRCTSVPIQHCYTTCLRRCSNGACLEWGTRCEETGVQTECHDDCFEQCSQNWSEETTTSYFTAECGFPISDTIEVRVSDGACGGLLRSSRNVSGSGTAAANVTLPLDPGVYDICRSGQLLQTVTVGFCGDVPICTVTTESNRWILAQGVASESFDVTVSTNGFAGGAYNLSLVRYDHDDHTTFLPLPGCTDLSAGCSWVSVPASATFPAGTDSVVPLTAINPQPVGAQVLWPGVVIRAEGPDTDSDGAPDVVCEGVISIGLQCQEHADCEDGSLCTVDTCDPTNREADLRGCVSAPACTSNDPCLLPICDPGTGTCSTANAPDGTVCTDGNICTTVDRCYAGACAGITRNCSDGNDCRDDLCDPVSGCYHPPVADGTGCDDTDVCSNSSSCVSGDCVGAEYITCPMDQCNTGVCNRFSGCVPVLDGTACDDGSLCTFGDRCEGGSCFAEEIECTALDQCHGVGVCDPATGVCSNPHLDHCCGDLVIDPGEECDDGNFIDGDGCDSDCLTEVCGNGRIEGTDECDDGNTDDFDGCGCNCRRVGYNADNCGACGVTCPEGQSCFAGVCGYDEFRIVTLDDATCISIDHDPTTGDDRGGVSVTRDRFFVNGDEATGSFMAANLADPEMLPVYDGLTGDLRAGTTWVYADSDGPIDRGMLATRLLRLDSDTGSLTTDEVQLSTPIELSFSAGVFAGYGRVVIISNGTVYSIDIPSGNVVDHGPAFISSYNGCENGLFYGVAEFFGGHLWLAYVQDSQTIARTRVFDGHTETIDTFDSLADMCSFTVSTARNRWYWHHEGCSDLACGSEMAGFCNAGFSTGTTAGVCGDGLLEPLFGEECDDGNLINEDGCNSVCQREGCANGRLDFPEECDDGNETDDDGCDSDCTLSDSDLDGVPNIFDNCPTVANPGQENTAPGAVTYVFDHTGDDRDVFEGDAAIYDPDMVRGGWLRADGLELRLGDCNSGEPFTGLDYIGSGGGLRPADLISGGERFCARVIATGTMYNIDLLSHLSDSGGCRDRADECTTTGGWTSYRRTLAGDAGDACDCRDGDGSCTAWDGSSGYCNGSSAELYDDDCTYPVNPCTGAPDGTSCDDGNACTTGDSCVAGFCTSGDPVTCSPFDQCHDAGVCNPATGLCSNPVSADGVSCNDGDACTQSDSCMSGTCVGSNPVTCMASDQCHAAGVCDPATGVCSNPNAADGTACSDGNECTLSDACAGGVCTGDAVTCEASDQCHVAGTCDMFTGACSNPAAPDGTTCNDSDACTQTDVCSSGSCTGTNPVVCAASDQCHAAGTCDPATGACSNPAVADGTACDDGNACTSSDSCTAGACGGSAISCDDGDPCSSDSCDTMTGCTHSAAPDGTACNDNDACTQTDVCSSGSCTGTNPVVCSASDQCHLPGTCDPATGMCSNPEANGAACEDGDFCTVGDTCIGGGCFGAPRSCDDGQECTFDICDSVLAACINSAGVMSGIECRASAGDCDLAESCDGSSGTCPADAKSTAECRGSSGTCDEAEMCDGFSNDCPADVPPEDTDGDGTLDCVDGCPEDAAKVDPGACGCGVSDTDTDGDGTPDCHDPCGDGFTGVGEMCDDGNAIDGDGCDSNCTLTACGNGVLTGSELCDDGNTIDGDGCDSNCTPSGCGNGVVTGAEQCDDSNGADGDGCDSNCTFTGCGNSVVTSGEACDDGNLFDGDGCDSNCTPSACGNGVVAGGEQCDDGNLVDQDGCDSNCTLPGCGNGVVNAGEACDDGNLTDGDGCDSNCTATACGNGVVSFGEGCDDSNLTDDDGCDSNCTPTGCGNGVITSGEACDDGNATDGDGCDSNCSVTACGNGVVTSGEGCDDGNATDGDGCDSNCTPTGCGNGIVTGGESCDDGNVVNGDGCESNCTITPPAGTLSVSCTPASVTVRENESAQTTCTVTSVDGFSGNASMSCGNLPADVSCGFAPGSVTLPVGGSQDVTVTISAGVSAPVGNHTISVVATGAATSGSANVAVSIAPCAPAGTPQIVFPTDGATGVPGDVTLQWTAVANADTYIVQVATEPMFTTPIRSFTGAVTSWSISPAVQEGLTYYWRVAANTVCNTRSPASSASFSVGTPPPNRLQNPGFESGPVAWTTAGTTQITNNPANPPNSGAWYAQLGGTNSSIGNLMQTVNVPADATTAFFQWRYRVTTTETGTQCRDTMTAEVRDANTLALLQSQMVCNVSVLVGTWRTGGPIDLSAYAGRSLIIRFFVMNDATNPSTFFVDDVVMAANGTP